MNLRLRFDILERDNFTCRYCGRAAPDSLLEVDHILPVSLGGGDEPDNLVTSCRDCNRGKKARLLMPKRKGPPAFADVEPGSLPDFGESFGGVNFKCKVPKGLHPDTTARLLKDMRDSYGWGFADGARLGWDTFFRWCHSRYGPEDEDDGS